MHSVKAQGMVELELIAPTVTEREGRYVPLVRDEGSPTRKIRQVASRRMLWTHGKAKTTVTRRVKDNAPYQSGDAFFLRVKVK